MKLISASTRVQLAHRLLSGFLPSEPDLFQTESILEAISFIKSSVNAPKVSAQNCYTSSGISGIFPDPAEFLAFFREYNTYLAENSLVDYEDMILGMYRSLSQHPERASKYADRFRYVLIDEFQDVNLMQYEIARLIAAAGDSNLYTVGDDDQSVYGFRGADPQIWNRMAADFPDIKRIILRNNYRSCPSVVRNSQLLISENRIRIPKNVCSASGKKGSVYMDVFPNREAELRAVKETLKKTASLTAQSGSERHAAVLFRNVSDCRSFSEYLRREWDADFSAVYADNKKYSSIPEDAVRAVYELFLSYFRFAYEIFREGGRRSDFFRIMNAPERFLLRSCALSERVIVSDLKRYAARNAGSAREITNLIRDLYVLDELPPKNGLKFLLEGIGLQKYLFREFPDLRTSLTSFTDGLSAAAEQKKESRSFIHYLEELIRNGEFPHLSSPDINRDSLFKIHIQTMHASKGLEYDDVFLPELNEGVIPNRFAVTAAAVEEERRLLYVAMTRAKENLFLYSVSDNGIRSAHISRFLPILAESPESYKPGIM